MKAFKLFALASLCSLVASERAPPSPDFQLLNASALDDKDIQLSNFSLANTLDPDQPVHTLAVSNAEWDDVVCRGRKLFLAMTRDGTQGTRYINPLTSSWDGNL
jgi:hypothetical protein